MASYLKKNAQNLLKKYKTRPSKRFGQNFLVDKKTLNRIVRTAGLKKKDIVLEIGPGIGILTQELARKAKKVIAIEKDYKLCEILKEKLNDLKNIKIIHGDILKIKNSKLEMRDYKIVANLPYYIVSPVIRRFLEIKNPPKEMILMVQKEVGQRICAKPPKMNLLAVSVQFYAKAKILFFVPKTSFWPQPKVDGAVIKIVTRDKKQEISINRDLFFKIVKAGFSQPRKQIANNLSKMLKLKKEDIKEWLLENGVKPSRRAEALNTKDWINLTKSYIIIQ